MSWLLLTNLMEQEPNHTYVEALKSISTAPLLRQQGDWFMEEI